MCVRVCVCVCVCLCMCVCMCVCMYVDSAALRWAVLCCAVLCWVSRGGGGGGQNSACGCGYVRGNGGVGSAGRRVSGDCVGGCRTVGGRALGFHFVMLANVLLASSLSSSSSSSLLNGVRNECVCGGGVHSGCQIRFSGDRREEVHKVRTGRPEEPKHMPKPYCGLRRLPPAHTRACTCTHAHAHARAHMHAHANSRTPTTYTHTHTQVVDPRFSVILTLIADRRLIRSKAFSPPAHPRGCAKARTESRQVNARESHACTRIASLESGVCANLASSA